VPATVPDARCRRLVARRWSRVPGATVRVWRHGLPVRRGGAAWSQRSAGRLRRLRLRSAVRGGRFLRWSDLLGHRLLPAKRHVCPAPMRALGYGYVGLGRVGLGVVGLGWARFIDLGIDWLRIDWLRPGRHEPSGNEPEPELAPRRAVPASAVPGADDHGGFRLPIDVHLPGALSRSCHRHPVPAVRPCTR
jgi:hypothetical protein